MYAIIKTGGKQYRVTEGQTLQVERLPQEAGKTVQFKEVLLVADGDDRHIGAPFVANAKVTAEVVEQTRGPKIDIIKLKRRKHHIKHMGHRQDYTAIKISEILIGEKKVAAAPKKVAKKKPAKKAAKAAAKKTAKKAAPKKSPAKKATKKVAKKK